jgi:hypothetical protein
MNWVNSMLSDSINKSISSKRVVTFLAFLMCSAAFIGDLFYNLDVKDSTYEGMMYIVIAGLGFTASEKFSKQKDNNSE